MKLEDLLVMEVPRKQLQHICNNYKLKPGSITSEAYAKTIVSDERALEEGIILANEYRFAGKTAVRVYKPVGDRLEVFNNINAFKGYLRAKYGDGILGSGLRVEPNDTPQLYRVDEYKDKLYLSFIYLGSEKPVFRNYDVIRERPHIVDFLVIHFNPLMLQVRVPLDKDEMFKKAFLNIMGIKEVISWVRMSELSISEFTELKETLRAGLNGAKHKMTEGAFDTVEVKAKPNIDLSTVPEYVDLYSGKPYRTLTFKFSYEYSNGIREDISVKVSKEGINFFSVVSEEVIEYFVREMLTIKMETFRRASATEEEAVIGEVEL